MTKTEIGLHLLSDDERAIVAAPYPKFSRQELIQRRDKIFAKMDSGNLDVVQAGPHLQSARSSDAAETWDAELTLDGLPGVPATFRTRDIIYDGVLSESFLRQWIFAFDLSVNQVWAARMKRTLVCR